MSVIYQSAGTGYGVGGGGTTTAVNKPSGTVSGDYLVMVQFSDPDTAGFSFGTPTGGTTWSAAGVQQSITSVGYSRLWSKFAGGSEPSTYSASVASGSDMTAIVLRFTGVHPTSPIGVSPSWANSATASTTHTAPTVTPPVLDGELVAFYYALNRDVSVGTAYSSVASPLTIRQDNPTSGGYVHCMGATGDVTSTAATGTKSATFPQSKPWIAALMVLNPAPSGAVQVTSQYNSYF